MPRHGRLWRWSDAELDRAVLLLAERGRPATFGMFDMYRVAHAITMVRTHGVGLRHALLMHGRIEVVDRSNPRKYRYRVRQIDGQPAQRPTPPSD